MSAYSVNIYEEMISDSHALLHLGSTVRQYFRGQSVIGAQISERENIGSVPGRALAFKLAPSFQHGLIKQNGGSTRNTPALSISRALSLLRNAQEQPKWRDSEHSS